MGNTMLIAKKELGSLLNEKTLLLAIVVQLLIASFSSLLVIGLASFFDPSILDKYEQRTNVGIVGEGELTQFIEKSRLNLRYYQDLGTALDDFNNQRIDAIVVIPPQSSEGTEIIQIVIYLPKSDIKGTFATLQLKKPLEEYEAFVRDVRSKRIGFEPTRLYVEQKSSLPQKTSTYFEFIYGILIPLLVFTPVFISGGLIIDMLTEEYEHKTMELLLVSPASFSEILNGKMLASVLIVPVQVVLWLTLVSLNGIAVYNVAVLLLLTSVLAFIIVLTGAIVAAKYRQRTISQYMYSLILIFLFLLWYLFADSPFNIVTRLSSGTIGIEAIGHIIAYASAALVLYMYVKYAQLINH